MSRIAFALLIAASMLKGQTADVSGHWEGRIHVPGAEVAIEADFSPSAAGTIEGTMNMPGENIKGLPVAHVGIDGRSVTFYARADQPFHGELSPDGKSLAGDFSIQGNVVPFALDRTGEARVIEAPKSARIGTELEGTWNGTLEAGMAKLRLVLTLENSAATSRGNIVNLDEGGLTMPVTITQDGSRLMLGVSIANASYTGVLSADGSELTGTFQQGAKTAPLSFHRTPVR